MPIYGSSEMQYLRMIYQNEAEYGKIDATASQKMLEEYGAFTQSITVRVRDEDELL